MTLLSMRARLLPRSLELDGPRLALRLRLWSGPREAERERRMLPAPPRPVAS